MISRDRKSKKTGPKPDTLKLEGDWKSLVGDALKKQRPPEGWPDPEKKSRKKKGC